MEKKRNTRITFKPYNQDQLFLLPPSLDDFIPAGHPVGYVNDIVDKINLDPLLKKYKGGGSSTYHPKMMLKVLVYAYLKNIYSSRMIESALKESVYFMWLSGMNQPDHNTINRFRSDRLKGVLKEVFGRVVELLVEAGLVTLKEVYIDGTKLEANANKYSFVWGRSIKSNKERIRKQLQELWQYTQELAKEEMEDTTSIDFEEIDHKKVQQTIEKIDQALKGKPVKKN
jgi:transposase